MYGSSIIPQIVTVFRYNSSLVEISPVMTVLKLYMLLLQFVEWKRRMEPWKSGISHVLREVALSYFITDQVILNKNKLSLHSYFKKEIAFWNMVVLRKRGNIYFLKNTPRQTINGQKNYLIQQCSIFWFDTLISLDEHKNYCSAMERLQCLCVTP